MSWHGNYELSPDQPECIAFHRHFYESGIIGRGYWMGHPIGKAPTDLLMYAEILHRTLPAILIETGTNAGGSGLFFADIMTLLRHGVVVSIDPFDREDGKERPWNPRLKYVKGSSIDPEIVGKALAIARGVAATNVRVPVRSGDASVMVVLDAVHAAGFVAEELRLWAPHVTKGCYLVVEDTNLNGHPVAPDHGPGPMEAVAVFLETDPGRCFEVDRSCERFGLTMSPGGFLKRVR